MAGVATQMTIRDGMTSKLNRIFQAVSRTNRALETTDALSDQVNPGANFDRAASAAGRASGQVDNFNNRQHQSEEGARKVASAWGLVKKAIGSALAAISVQKVIELADSMTSTRARLDIMNDGLQTTDELQSMIMKSANRSRAAYQTTADAVSKMGIMAKDAFSNNDELIKFTELINKQFTIAGTSAAGIDAAKLARFHLSHPREEVRVTGGKKTGETTVRSLRFFIFPASVEEILAYGNNAQNADAHAEEHAGSHDAPVFRHHEGFPRETRNGNADRRRVRLPLGVGAEKVHPRAELRDKERDDRAEYHDHKREGLAAAALEQVIAIAGGDARKRAQHGHKIIREGAYEEPGYRAYERPDERPEYAAQRAALLLICGFLIFLFVHDLFSCLFSVTRSPAAPEAVTAADSARDFSALIYYIHV